MILSPGRRFVFVHIPKTGGTSMSLALEARARADDILIGDTPKAERRKHRLKTLDAPGRLWKHARLADIDGLSQMPDDPFVFTLVRNPWDRMASLYHWARQQEFQHPMIAAAKALSFGAFLFSPALEPAFVRDNAEHYVTDAHGRLRCDAFVRIEHPDTDLRPVERHLGFRLAPLPHVNRSNHPPPASLYTGQTKNRVAALFAPDIARFGYEFPEDDTTGQLARGAPRP